MSSLMLALVLQALPGAAPDTVVVCPHDFRQALQPWLAYRREQGHVIAQIPAIPLADGIKAQIRHVAQGGRLRYVMLVGDVPDNPLVTTRSSPTCYVNSKAVVRYGSEPEIASDNGYADLDGDEVPDLAVGRLTADTPAELSAIVAKILAYEESLNYGSWRTRVNFIAGVGGFGPIADPLIESTMRRMISAGVPPTYSTTMTYGSWRSPYCPDPRAFHQTTVDRLNEGCLYWVYMGHAYPWYLSQLRVPGGAHHIFDVNDVAKLKCGDGSPIAIFLSCYAAAFDAEGDCLAEELLRSSGGPVAVIGASRVSMPYAMAVMGSGLLDEAFQKRRATLGETLLLAKRSLVAEAAGNSQRELLDPLATMLSPVGWNLAVERTEHLHLFNLLGDPLLRLQYPQEVKLTVPKEAKAGRKITVRGSSTVDGPCTIELIYSRDKLGFKPPARDQYPSSSAALAAYQAIYQKANNPRLATMQTGVEEGKFAATLLIPADAKGLFHVRAYVNGEEDFAAGTAEIHIEKN